MSCYFQYDDTNIQLHSEAGPCVDAASGVVQCCNYGDLCMGNGLCQETQSSTSRGTPFYVGGCTDPEFKSSACPTTCVSQPTSDIIYDYYNGTWECCGDSCSNPSSVTMNAPPPVSLQYVATLASNGSIYPLATGVPLQSSSASASATATSANGFSSGADKSSSQSGGAASGAITPGIAAGIAVAAVIGLLVVIAAVGFLIWRIRRRSAGLDEKTQYVYLPASSGPGPESLPSSSANHAELRIPGPMNATYPPPEHEVGIDDTGLR